MSLCLFYAVNPIRVYKSINKVWYYITKQNRIRENRRLLLKSGHQLYPESQQKMNCLQLQKKIGHQIHTEVKKLKITVNCFQDYALQQICKS